MRFQFAHPERKLLGPDLFRGNLTMTTAELRYLDIRSTVMESTVPAAVILPPDFDPSDRLPLLIELHHAGTDRGMLGKALSVFSAMFTDGVLRPLVVVSFSAGPYSFYGTQWEGFIKHELPSWAHSQFNTRTDAGGVALAGISMGGYGGLKTAFREPSRFAAVAALASGIAPCFNYNEKPFSDRWWREGFDQELWGAPVDPEAWQQDQPANLVANKADEIRRAGLEIYLEVGDLDCFDLHNGSEFLHRVLWEHEIAHEYHLVRWADHQGKSIRRRFIEAHAFIDAALHGGRRDTAGTGVNNKEQAFLDWWFALSGGKSCPLPAEMLDLFDVNSPTVVARMFEEARAAVSHKLRGRPTHEKLPHPGKPD